MPRGDNAGRPRFEFTDQVWSQIEAMAKIQCTHEEIASVLGINADTLTRNKEFVPRYNAAKENGKSSLRRKQWSKAMEGDRVMLKWLGKQYLDQREKTDEVHTLQGSISTKTTVEGPLAGMSSGQLEKLLANIDKMANGGGDGPGGD